jgi:hypothetical protein
MASLDEQADGHEFSLASQDYESGWSLHNAKVPKSKER